MGPGPQGPVDGRGSVTDADPAVAAENLSDGQILFVVDSLNAGEVDQARVSLPRLENDQVREFATLMIEEHELARDRLLELAEREGLEPAASDVATSLRSESETALQSLLATQRPADAPYLRAQVTAHTEAQELVLVLIDAADSEPLREGLGELHAGIETHLERARELQDTAVIR